MHFQQQKSNALVRKELQAHLLGHAQLLAGYTDYLRRHTHALLQLVLDRPQARCLIWLPDPPLLALLAIFDRHAAAACLTCPGSIALLAACSRISTHASLQLFGECSRDC